MSAGDFVRLTIDTRGIKNLLRYLELAPTIATQSARMAINDVAKGEGLKLLRRSIEDQVAFPRGYLDDPSRLGVRRLATNNKLEAVIGARARATSLARFAGTSPFPTPKGSAVHVAVKPGVTKSLKNAFFVRLNRGASFTEDNYNLGLAVRLKPGTVIHNKNRQNSIQLSHNVYLLYGPSVDQVFNDVAIEQAEPLAAMVDLEFARQFSRLSEEI